MKHIMTLILATALTGCLTSGKQFIVADKTVLLPGVTKIEDTSLIYGYDEKGHISETPLTESEIIEKIYAFASSNHVKRQLLYFYQGILVGYDTGISFPEQSTFFNHKLAEQITVNSTTRTEVIKLLGRPGGKHIYPMAPKGAYNESYYYRRVTPGSVTYTFDITDLYLVITYDENDTVIDTYEKFTVVDN